MNRDIKAKRKVYDTYSHLQNKEPSPYDIATDSLLYFPKLGFEVKTPITEWYEKSWKENGLHELNLNKFSDPLKLTYTAYVKRRKEEEEGLEKVLADFSARPLVTNSLLLETFEKKLLPSLYPLHALQMVAAFIGQAVPESKASIVAAFQAADEMRKIQHISRFASRIKDVRKSFGENRKQVWEEDPFWQPIRQVTEELLVTYSWVEALVALNEFMKPFLQQLIVNEAKSSGAPELTNLIASFWDQETWHKAWSQLLLGIISDSNSQNRALIEKYRSKWKGKILMLETSERRAA